MQHLQGLADAAAAQRAGGAADELGLASGGWMGSLTALLLRTLLDTALTVNNLVVKLLTPAAPATLTCRSLCIATCRDAWRDALQVHPDCRTPGAAACACMCACACVYKAGLWYMP